MVCGSKSAKNPSALMRFLESKKTITWGQFKVALERTIDAFHESLVRTARGENGTDPGRISIEIPNTPETVLEWLVHVYLDAHHDLKLGPGRNGTGGMDLRTFVTMWTNDRATLAAYDTWEAGLRRVGASNLPFSLRGNKVYASSNSQWERRYVEWVIDRTTRSTTGVRLGGSNAPIVQNKIKTLSSRRFYVFDMNSFGILKRSVDQQTMQNYSMIMSLPGALDRGICMNDRKTDGVIDQFIQSILDNLKLETNTKKNTNSTRKLKSWLPYIDFSYVRFEIPGIVRVGIQPNNAVDTALQIQFPGKPMREVPIETAEAAREAFVRELRRSPRDPSNIKTVVLQKFMGDFGQIVYALGKNTRSLSGPKGDRHIAFLTGDHMAGSIHIMLHRLLRRSGTPSNAMRLVLEDGPLDLTYIKGGNYKDRTPLTQWMVRGSEPLRSNVNSNVNNTNDENNGNNGNSRRGVGVSCEACRRVCRSREREAMRALQSKRMR